MNPSSVVQRFDAVDDCERLIPSGTVRSSLSFQEVTVFEELLDPADFWNIEQAPADDDAALDGPMISISVALPLWLVNHYYAQITKPRIVTSSSGIDRAIGGDRAFLPTKKPHELLVQRTRPHLAVDPASLTVGETTVDDVKVLVTEAALRLLRSHGRALVERTGGKGRAMLNANVRSVQVPDLAQLLSSGRMTHGEHYLTIALTAAEEKRLRRGESPVVRLESGEFVRLEPPPVRNSGISRRIDTAMNSGSSSGSSGTGAVATLFSGAPASPPGLHNLLLMGSFDGDVCAMVAALRADPRAGDDFLPGLPVNEDIAAIPNPAFASIVFGARQMPQWESCVAAGGAFQGAAPAELPKFEIGLVSSYRQEWELLGYSRGALLSSITMAPREEVKLEVFSWDRFKLEEEQRFGTEYERNREINSLARGSATMSRDLTQSLGTQVGVNGEIAFPVKAVKVGGGGSGEVTTQIDDAMKQTVERINEATLKSVDRFKATHQVKIVQTHERGEERRSIRRFQNPNASRTLTLHHFEVQEHHRVTTQVLTTNQFCLLVENPRLPSFDLDFILAHESRLQQVLISPNYIDGFKAARVLAAQRWLDDMERAEEERKAERIADQRAAMQGTDDAQTASANSPHFPNKGIFATARQIRTGVQKFIALESLDTLFDSLLAHLNPFSNPPITVQRVKQMDQRLNRHMFWFRMTVAYPGFEEQAREFVAAIRAEEESPSPQSKENVVAAVSLLVNGLDDDWMFSLKTIGLPLVIAGMIALTPKVQFATAPIAAYLAKSVLFPDDLGLPPLLSKARQQAASFDAMQQVDTLADVVPAAAVPSEGAEYPPVPQAPRIYSVKDVAEAQADFQKLTLHLEANRLYYQNEIWKLEDPTERYMRLTQIGLARFVENRLIGFAGDKAMYPLRVEALPDDVQAALTSQFSSSSEPDPVEEQVTLPTAGVHMEAVLGRCDAIEPYLVERRALDLQLREAGLRLAEAQALQAEEEANRLAARLSADPPQLGFPFQAAAVTNDTSGNAGLGGAAGESDIL